MRIPGNGGIILRIAQDRFFDKSESFPEYFGETACEMMQ
jgi:hypothetical protein